MKPETLWQKMAVYCVYRRPDEKCIKQKPLKVDHLRAEYRACEYASCPLLERK